MALINTLKGQTPSGDMVPLPIAGAAFTTTTALAANASWESPILPYNGLEAVHFSFQADQIGSYIIEYYKNGAKVNFTGNPTPFDPSVLPSFQGALAGKGDSFKFKFTNGPVAQTVNFGEIKFTDRVQETLRSIAVPMSATNLASTTHAAIEGRQNGTGNYLQASVTNNGTKNGLDVNIINQNQVPATTGTFQAVSLLANVQQTIAANPAREGVIISSATGTILIGIGFTATATNWTYRIVTNGTVEIPAVLSGLSISLFSTTVATANVTLLT